MRSAGSRGCAAAVFGFVLERLRESRLLSGKDLGVDATEVVAGMGCRSNKT